MPRYLTPHSNAKSQFGALCRLDLVWGLGTGLNVLVSELESLSGPATDAAACSQRDAPSEMSI